MVEMDRDWDSLDWAQWDWDSNGTGMGLGLGLVHYGDGRVAGLAYSLK